MSAATYQVPEMRTGVVMETSLPRLEDIRQDLREIVCDLVALKQMARDGIQTHHSQRELVKHLNAKELAAVARGVSLAEKRSQPIFNRPAQLNNPSGNK
jgi:hypothetical protein